MTIDERITVTMSAILGVPEERITPESSPETLEQWDSLNAMNLAVGIEEEFGTQFSDDEIAQMKSYGLIRAMLVSKGVE